MTDEIPISEFFKTKYRMGLFFIGLNTIPILSIFVIVLLNSASEHKFLGKAVFLVIFTVLMDGVLIGFLLQAINSIPEKLTSCHISWTETGCQKTLHFCDIVRVEYPTIPPQQIKLITSNNIFRLKRFVLRDEQKFMEFLANVLPHDTEISDPSGPTTYGTRFQAIVARARNTRNSRNGLR